MVGALYSLTVTVSRDGEVLSVSSVAQQSSFFHLRRLSPALGAEITGIDLNEPHSSAVHDAIVDAFLAHHLLVFRNQSLDGDAQTAFTLRFGELEEHVIRLRDGEKAPLLQTISNLDADGKPTARPYSVGNYFWHTDKSYHAVPSLATLLHAVQLPPTGGDTLFANTELGYATLPSDRQAELAGLQVVHSWEASRRNTGNKPATKEEIAERPPVTHPLVRTHPDTHEKVLYLGMHCSHVEAMDDQAGRELLTELLQHTTQDAFVYRHCWQPGDLVMWDNRCLLHRADDNYEMGKYPRVLHRSVVRGTKPY